MYSVSAYASRLVAYLTGLIKGDGAIVLPRTERTINGQLQYPFIKIIFYIKDLPLSNHIRAIQGHGSVQVKRNANACVQCINNLSGHLLVIDLINGLFRTPKINALYSLIDYYNAKGYSISKLPQCTVPLSSNA